MSHIMKANRRKRNQGLGWLVWLSVALAGVCIGFGIWAGYKGYKIPRTNTDPLQDWGNLGSFLQGTTASFWALAGVFLIFAAFMAQKKQLTLQQQQFEQQSFENHFFQLLTLHQEIVSDLRYKDVEVEGRQIFPVFYRHVQLIYEDETDRNNNVEEGTEALAVICYERIFDENPEALGHYFRNLYHIIKFVDESSVEDKKRYTSLVRAQLSSYEHVLLHYNGLSGYGVEKFKRLIQDYALLENMGPALLLNPDHPTSYSGTSTTPCSRFQTNLNFLDELYGWSSRRSPPIFILSGRPFSSTVEPFRNSGVSDLFSFFMGISF